MADIENPPNDAEATSGADVENPPNYEESEAIPPDDSEMTCCEKIGERCGSMKYAFNGFVIVTRDHAIRALMIHNGVLLLLTFPFLHMPILHYFLFLYATTLALCFEGINTAIEYVANYIQPEFDPKIGEIKDLGAFIALFGMGGNILFVYAIIVYNIVMLNFWPYLLEI